MILIRKGEAPPELLELEQQAVSEGLSADEAYGRLRNPLKNDLRELLMKEQGHLCAYCMQRIPDDTVRDTKGVSAVSIEHYSARNPAAPESGSDSGLNYQTLLAVCSGNESSNEKRRKRDLTCGAKRGNKPLNLNPLDPVSMASISYEPDGKVVSHNKTFQEDLDFTLNLNCLKFKDARSSVLKQLQRAVIDIDGDVRLDDCRLFLKRFESETDPKTPFVGILIWWLNEFISSGEKLRGRAADSQFRHER